MRHIKKSLTLAVAASVLSMAAPAVAQDVTIGFMGGFTGPIESLAPPIFAGAELAVAQVNEQGGILDGGTFAIVSADGACDATAAANATDRLVNTDQVTAIVGGLCTGETIGGANSAAIPGGVVMISPASTAPALTTLEDDDLVFRTTPSDAFQGQKLAELLLSKDITEIALTYVNNDYGSGFADAVASAYEAGGGTIAANLAHEDGKADYRAELGNLASSGAETLVILAYANSSGQTILRQALESGNFLTFVGGDGMVGDDLFTGVDAGSVEGMIATRAGAFEGESATVYNDLATAAGLTPNDVYAPQSYDAAFLLALAIEKNGSADREGLSAALREVSSAPGETILPGEWEKAKELIAAGTDIDYQGAGGDLDFDDAGDVDGVIVEMTVEGGSFVEVGVIE
ncbi:ABC transporter substrate-binding protein [Pelagibacterium halotolerans]|uniref:Branched-chain amino acid ABC transporter, amino acid-binding protein n=1 Tax=Pelagibacterium halotolerans (strain DSM 22347 / JCM 15775 / CGMCC 1.7692 / B2) TaxID=1082931 RepID=G4RG76_PELHB|nr:ABC transporter substrate-binding protein [Pelagibacterium halotolerans]AEQ53052.1 branched-chain amino acid ABC transporter, amino acid-binding protein [Pelagibacterium halotolerans B2]QJR17294.1 ABC transporter substrate-binding protein [Pelagibacterium halotolerans]SEA86864.1 branched-chain amino acid transport system substrate-binding protein [Pelagibacterium halotolerans]